VTVIVGLGSANYIVKYWLRDGSSTAHLTLAYLSFSEEKL